MIRRIFFFTAVILSLFAAPVAAQSPTPVPPSRPPVLQGPNANVSGTLSRSETVFLGALQSTFGINLTGLIRLPTLAVPNLTAFADWLTSSQPALLPLIIQQNIRHFTTPQTVSSKYSVCISSSVSNKAVSEKTADTEKTAAVPWIPPLVEGSEVVNALLGRNKVLSKAGVYDFDRPNAEISDAAGCGANTPAAAQQAKDVAVVQNAQFLTAKLEDIVQRIVSLFPSSQKTADVTTKATVTKSTVLSRAESLCNAGGCSASDVANAPADLDKEQLPKTGGFAQTFLSTRHQDVGEAAGKAPNTLTIGAATITLNVPFALTHRTETMLTRARCSLAPATKRDSLGLTAAQCSPQAAGPVSASNVALDNGTGSSSSPPPTLGRYGKGIARRPDVNPQRSGNDFMQGIIEEAAKRAGIPRCVLEGVAIIEGAYNWGVNDDHASPCIPNRCAAAGPFQITTGADGSGNPTCPACGHGFCPNIWESRSGTPCDSEAAAAVAAQLLAAAVKGGNPTGQEAAIREAGRRYLGNEKAQSSLPINPKTRTNYTYGEFLVAHCQYIRE